MPWQRLVADVGLELDPQTGLPAYREVWFTIHRQGGKTSLALPWEVHRCVSPVWGGPQRVAYTAQTGWEAQKKLIEDQVPIVRDSPLGRLISPAGGGKVRRAQGNWGVNFGGGGRIDVLGSTSSAGHGQTLDLGVIDEAWKDEDDRREQSMLPAMITRPAAQLLGYSTQGTEQSTYLNRKVEVGRAAAVESRGHGMAYFEWSIPEDADIDDPETWWQYMPALGWTITEDAVAHARQTMTEGEFRRAFGNQRTGTGERLIPAHLWDAVQNPAAEPSGDLSWGVDVLRSVEGHADSGSIGVADESGRVACVDNRPGTTWLVDRMVQLHARRKGRVVVDGGGPAASIADDLEDAGLPVIRLGSGEVASACGRMYDAVADGRVKVYPSPQLDEAASVAVKKPVGDRFVFARAASPSDVTPLMSVTLAYSRGEQEVKPFVVIS